MSDKQKLLIAQLRLAGLGLIIAGMGWMFQRLPIFWVGLAVFVFGLVRFAGFKHFLDKS